jgi:hypothetical protein
MPSSDSRPRQPNGNDISDGLSSSDQLAELTSALAIATTNDESPPAAAQHPDAIDLGGSFTSNTASSFHCLVVDTEVGATSLLNNACVNIIIHMLIGVLIPAHPCSPLTPPT